MFYKHFLFSFFLLFFLFFFGGGGIFSPPRLNIFTVGNMGVMICRRQGGLRSLSASSWYILMHHPYSILPFGGTAVFFEMKLVRSFDVTTWEEASCRPVARLFCGGGQIGQILGPFMIILRSRWIWPFWGGSDDPSDPPLATGLSWRRNEKKKVAGHL